jgi:hypothetical protein
MVILRILSLSQNRLRSLPRDTFQNTKGGRPIKSF